MLYMDPTKTFAEILSHVPLNPDTGEYEDQTIGELFGILLDRGAIKQPKVKHRVRRFVLLNPDPLTQVTLTPIESRVFFAIVGDIKTDAGCESIAPTPMIAKRLGLHASAVSRAVRGLENKTMLKRVGQGAYEVNPWVAYNGDLNEWKRAMLDWPKPGHRLVSVVDAEAATEIAVEYLAESKES